MQLTTDERGGRFMSDGVEETVNRKVLFFARDHVLDAEISEKVPVSLTLGRHGVPKNGLGPGEDATVNDTV